MDEIRNETVNNNFYTKAEDYWSNIPATVDGMLGGFGWITLTDIQGSRQFLKKIFTQSNGPTKGYALDCGAGIGRVTKNLLSEIFEKVDLVEQNPKFLEEAKVNLDSKSNKIGNFYPVGLQDFEPEANKYDVIWCQWVLGHLTNEDLIQFFIKCQKALKPNGVIIVKENVTGCETNEADDNDSSITRSYDCYLTLFDKANLHCFKKEKQSHFPKQLYKVFMFGLKPKVT